MKDATQYAEKLKALQKELLEKEAPEPEGAMKPVLRLVHAFLMWNANRSQADNAFDRLVAGIVDANDLRVHTEEEICDVLGPRYPVGPERTARMLDSLQEIYDRERDTTLERLNDLGKKEIREYLKTLPGMVPYAEASVSLLAFDAHAVPVDDKLMEALASEGVIHPEADLAETIAFVEHHILADDAVATHAAFQAWSDEKAGRVTSKQVRELREATGSKSKGAPLESKKVIIRKTSKATKKRSEAAKKRAEKKAAREKAKKAKEKAAKKKKKSAGKTKKAGPKSKKKKKKKKK